MEENNIKTDNSQGEVIEQREVAYVVVKIPQTKTKYKVRTPLKNTQLEDIAKLLIKDDGKSLTTEAEILQDIKIACKAAAIYLLPGLWKRKLFYGVLWRWFYYIKQYDNIQLEPILSAGLNATPYISFLKTMSILVNQKETQMRMTRKEAEKVMQEMAIRQDKAEEISNEKS